MTTLDPRQPYTANELRQLYPGELSLEQVQVILRHGERTPVTSRFRNAGLPAFWPYCNAARQLRSVIRSSDSTWDELAYRRKLETFNGIDDSPSLATGPGGETDGICLPGELTDKGRNTTLALGQRLRNLYVDQLGFMPSVLETTDHLYLRATPIPRALESVQQAFYGMYPPEKRAPGLPAPEITTRSADQETLFPNEGGCRRFAQLSQAFAQRTADRWNDSSDMKYLNKLLSKWMPENSKTVKVDSHPRLSGIMDTMNSTLAHGKETKLPKEFYDPKGRDIIEKIGVEEWFSGYTESREYRALGIGGHLGDVVSRMVEHIDHSRTVPVPNGTKAEPRDLKLSLAGAHDTTLAAILSSLGAFNNEKWPPYTSHVAIELFKQRTQSELAGSTSTVGTSLGSWWTKMFGPAKNLLAPASSSSSSPRKPMTSLSEAERQRFDGWYARIRYNDRVVTIPGCRPAGKHFGDDESICTLEAFKTIVDKFTPKDWKKECGSRLNEDAFPEDLEPAGI